MRVIDTNIFIRFFTQDNEKLFKEAHYILTSGEDTLYVPESVFPEIEYVLSRLYKKDRADIKSVLAAIIQQSNIKTSEVVRLAYSMYVESNLDFADSLVVAHAVKKGSLESFDKEMINQFEKYS